MWTLLKCEHLVHVNTSYKCEPLVHVNSRTSELSHKWTSRTREHLLHVNISYKCEHLIQMWTSRINVNTWCISTLHSCVHKTLQLSVRHNGIYGTRSHERCNIVHKLNSQVSNRHLCANLLGTNSLALIKCARFAAAVSEVINTVQIISSRNWQSVLASYQ